MYSFLLFIYQRQKRILMIDPGNLKEIERRKHIIFSLEENNKFREQCTCKENSPSSML